jgi:O-antigen ligase
MTATVDAPAGTRPRPDRSTGHGRSGPWLGRALRYRRHPLPEHWPFTALAIGFPLWWAMGFGPFAVTVFAIPMAWKLRKMRPIRVPRGFGVWLMFILAVLVSGLMLGKTAPNTLPTPVTGQILGYFVRVAAYVAAAVLLLFLGNLGEKALPERLILTSLVILLGATVLGGYLGLALPHFSFTSPIEAVLPRRLANGYLHALIHPASAQVQDVLGHPAPRPMAPFEYTNTWGNVIGVLMVWLVAWAGRNRPRRLLALAILTVAAVPVVVSLNRGLWIGLTVAVAIVAVRLVMSGRLFAVVGLTTLVAVLAVLFVASPLNAVVQERLANPHSNDVRSNLAEAAISGALESPIVGWGTNRQVVGSFQSIAIGASAQCAGRCGNASVGSTGTFWLILFSEGFVGIGLYLGFFLLVLWYYRRDRTASGIAAQVTLIMSFWFTFVYSSTGWPLALAMVSVAVLWRHHDEAVEA